MLPLQAGQQSACDSSQSQGDGEVHTILLLHVLQNLLLVKSLWETLDSSQSLTTIALCRVKAVSQGKTSVGVSRP